MRYHALIDLGELTAPAFVALVEGFATIDLDYLRRNPQAPKLYRSNLRYLWEPWTIGANGVITRPPDIWRDYPAMIAAGVANCKDFVAVRLAELRLAGKRVRPVVLETKLADGRSLFHVVVEWMDRAPGASGLDNREDPSLQMGMPANQIDLVTAHYRQLQAGQMAPAGSDRAAVGLVLPHRMPYPYPGRR